MPDYDEIDIPDDQIPLAWHFVVQAKHGGDLAEQAAVKFLTEATDLLTPDMPWVDVKTGVIDWGEIDFDWHYLSSGQVAAWRLAYSMVRGEFGKNFWRLDRGNRLLFVNSLTADQS